MIDASYKDLIIWKEPTGWMSEAKENFLSRNYDLIKVKLLQLNSKNCEYHIFDGSPVLSFLESDENRKYLNNCGETKDWIYPIKSIVISYKIENDIVQDHFEFLRTENGYKLISISIRNGEVK